MREGSIIFICYDTFLTITYILIIFIVIFNNFSMNVILILHNFY